MRAAYDAPFPTEQSKACVRALPGLIPRSPEDEGAALIQAAHERLAEWENPAFVLFSDGDPITGFARDPLRGLFSRAGEQPDIWIEGAMDFLQEDAGTEIAAFVGRT